MENGNAGARILIAHTQAMFRDGLRTLLNKEPDFRVVGETDDGEAAVQLVCDIKPDIFLLDLKLRECSGLRTLRRLSSIHNEVRSILLIAATERQEIMTALQFGARGLVPQDSETNLLFKGIRAVMAGDYWISHEIVSELIKSLCSFKTQSQQQNHDLSGRELQIVGAIVSGCSNKEIARKLSVSEQQVKHRLTTIFAKVGVSGRTELALFSIRHGLVSEV